MSSDTDISTSSSPEKYKKHKKSKKLKRKSDKKKHKHKERKEKRHKDKKRGRQEKHRVETAATLLEHGSQSTEIDKINDAFGPALPPHLIKDDPKINKTLIGPVLPRELLQTTESTKATGTREPIDKDNVEEDNAPEFLYGPIPVSFDSEGMAQMSAAQIELEQRALELKLAAIEGATEQTTDAKVREEWMLELPAVGLKGGLAALSNMKRTFHQGKERPDFSDR